MVADIDYIIYCILNDIEREYNKYRSIERDNGKDALTGFDEVCDIIFNQLTNCGSFNELGNIYKYCLEEANAFKNRDTEYDIGCYDGYLYMAQIIESYI